MTGTCLPSMVTVMVVASVTGVSLNDETELC
jgi:hypothetical protein